MATYKRILLGIFFLSIAIVIWIDFFDKYWIPSPFYHTDKINQLLETISLAYITSYIFYSIVILFKEYEDKKIILPFIADYTYVAMNNCVLFCSTLRDWADLDSVPFSTSIHNRNLNIYPTKDELKTICEKINPNQVKETEEELDGFRAIPCFFGIMIKYTHEINYFLTIILEKSSFLDTELVKILTEIKTHGYHKWMLSYDKSLIFSAKHRHDNLLVFEESFLGYFNLFRKLEKYAEKNLSKHVERKDLLHS